MTRRLRYAWSWVFFAASPCLAKDVVVPPGQPALSVGTAQEPVVLRVGDRVRLRLAGPDKVTETGTIAAIDHDSLTLASVRVKGEPGPSKEVRQHSFGSVSRLEIYRGRHRATGKGALAGALALGLVVGIAEASVCASNSSDWGCGHGLYTASWAAVGGGLGALVGTAFKEDTWDKVPLPPGGTNRTASPAHGAGIQITLRF